MTDTATEQPVSTSIVIGDAPPAPPAIPPEFLVERQGQTFVTYRGLVHLAHTQGLSATTTELVQAPSAENGHTAIFRATVTTERGTFSGWGDANPGNVGRNIAPHALRMAETRSLARALRVATDVAFTALEELGGDDAPAPATAVEAVPPKAADVIKVGEQFFNRSQVWATYQRRRMQALAAKVVQPGDALLGHKPDAELKYLVGASQRLKRMTDASAPAAAETPAEAVEEEVES